MKVVNLLLQSNKKFKKNKKINHKPHYLKKLEKKITACRMMNEIIQIFKLKLHNLLLLYKIIYNKNINKLSLYYLIKKIISLET